jgi:SAM-dependent methyltransferase
MTHDVNEFISDINWDYILNYFISQRSLFRHYQNIFIEKYGKEFHGTVIEIGAEIHYNNRIFFPNVDKYLTSNLSLDRGEVDIIIDITNISNIESNSIDGLICVSVLEHVDNLDRAIGEIHRILRKDGKLILTVPFAFPYHDVVDYWRLGKDIYFNFFNDFHIHKLTNLGGTFSSIVNVLQRPKGNFKGRYFIYKSLGIIMAIIGKFLDTADGFPLGYGLHASKR